MFNGSIYFAYKNGSYVVNDFVEYSWPTKNKIFKSWPAIKCINIEGTFNFKPAKGQFCKRPHKIIDWSK